jgi:16S rRNA (cytidine1402-2'-O)-methyltransferase
MTKPHEEFLRGRISEIRRNLSARAAVKGECTLLVAGATDTGEPSADDLAEAVGQALDAGMSVSEAARAIAGRYRMPRSRVYETALSLKKNRHAGEGGS